MKKVKKAKRLVVDKGDADRDVMRDNFAAMALSGLLAADTTYVGFVNEKTGNGWPSDIDEFRSTIAYVSYQYADAMLAAREAK